MSNIILSSQKIIKQKDQKIENTIFNYRSKELFINLKETDIPPYGHKDREDFISWEEEKCVKGITINGEFIPPTLYWDFNHWAIMQDVIDSRGMESTVPIRPDIRDNDWMIHKALYEAEQKKENLVMGTARQISKSKNIGSVFGRDLMLFDNRINLLMAGASIYLVPIMAYLINGTENCTEFFRVPRLTKDKKAITINWGFKDRQNEEFIKSTLHIRNAREGQNTEVSAGVTIHRSAIDEIATFPFRSSYETLRPALIGKNGIRSSSILAFCVCTGTKVWNKDGQLVNIEDITLDSGIIGYNGKSYLKQEVKRLKPIAQKECIRITTKGNNVISCSIDHPLLIDLGKKMVNGQYKKSITFKKALELKVGDSLMAIKNMEIFGTKTNSHARLIGLLMGNGTYGRSGNVQIGTSDKDIHDFLNDNYSINHFVKYDFQTGSDGTYKRFGIRKVGNILRETGILGQTKFNKRLPTDVHTYTKISLCELLGGYFDADGTVSIIKKNAMRVVLTSICKPLLTETKFHLLKLGIKSSIVKENRNKKSLGTIDHIFRLYIQDVESLIEFQKNIKFLIKDKQGRLDRVLSLTSKKMHNNYDCIFVKGEKGKYFEGMENMKNLRSEYIKKIEYLGIKEVVNLTTTPTHTYITNGFISANTGGDVTKSKDAEEVFMNPGAGNFAKFENESKLTGLFIGGWYRQDLKVEKNLGEWLNIKDKSSEFYDLKVRVTDFDHANKILDEEELQASKSTDITAITNHKTYNARTIADMFLTPDVNPFNIEAMKQHQRFLLENPVGVPIDLYRGLDGKVKYKISNKKPIMNYPIKDQLRDLDAPPVIYDFPKYTEHYELHVAGWDSYNQDKTKTSDSLGSFYIIRRIHSDLEDSFINCIVASYTARPDRLRDHFQMVELLQEFYNCSILFEHSGSPVVPYFEEKLKTHVLMDTYSFQKEINPRSNSSATKGLKATEGNKEYLLNLALMYTTEILPDGRLGLTRIPDPMLLEEMIQYDGDKNVDRYDAFAHALGNMYSKAKYNVRPFITTEREEKPKENKSTLQSAFGNLKGLNNAFGFNNSSLKKLF